MAYIYQKGKTWYFTVTAGKDGKGNKNRINGGGYRLKKDAIAAAAVVESEYAKGTFVKEQDIIFSDFANEWVERYKHQVKPPTVRIRKNEINRLNEYFAARMLRSISKKEYQNCLYDMFNKKGYSESTVSGTHGTARMIFRNAVELDVIKADPTEFAKPPRKIETLEEIEKKDEIPKYLEKEDLATFLRIAHDGGLYQDYAIFLLLAYTGIRVGELCALKWSDILFEESLISITKTYYNPTNNLRKYELGLPKTKSSRRNVHVSAKVLKELELHRARQRKEEMKNKNVWHKEDFVFTADKYPGYPAYVKLIDIRMDRLLRISGLPTELTPHSLRHTHTSLLAEAGVGLEEIMERLGHVDDDTTRKVYLHVTKEMKKEAAHKFDALMDGL